MRKIKLKHDKPFHNNCDIAIIDVTDGKEKQRGKLTVEYAKADINMLKKQGMDYDDAMEYFKSAIDSSVKHYIADDWICTEGCDEVMEVIASHIRTYYE